MRPTASNSGLVCCSMDHFKSHAMRDVCGVLLSPGAMHIQAELLKGGSYSYARMSTHTIHIYTVTSHDCQRHAG